MCCMNILMVMYFICMFQGCICIYVCIPPVCLLNNKGRPEPIYHSGCCFIISTPIPHCVTMAPNVGPAIRWDQEQVRTVRDLGSGRTALDGVSEYWGTAGIRACPICMPFCAESCQAVRQNYTTEQVQRSQNHRDKPVQCNSVSQ